MILLMIFSLHQLHFRQRLQRNIFSCNKIQHFFKIAINRLERVDEEGRIETGSRTRDSQVRGGIGAAAGAILGGIVGGGKGALIGLILGGAAGVGTVYVDGNKNLILDAGTEMVIRVAKTRDNNVSKN